MLTGWLAARRRARSSVRRGPVRQAPGTKGRIILVGLVLFLDAARPLDLLAVMCAGQLGHPLVHPSSHVSCPGEVFRVMRHNRMLATLHQGEQGRRRRHVPELHPPNHRWSATIGAQDLSGPRNGSLTLRGYSATVTRQSRDWPRRRYCGHRPRSCGPPRRYPCRFAPRPLRPVMSRYIRLVPFSFLILIGRFVTLEGMIDQERHTHASSDEYGQLC